MRGSEVSTSVVKWNEGLSNRVSIIIRIYIDHTSLVNKTNSAHNLFLVYLSISTCFGRLVPIIRRNNCVYATLGTCYSVWMTVWYVGWNAYPAYQTVIHTE